LEARDRDLGWPWGCKEANVHLAMLTPTQQFLALEDKDSAAALVREQQLTHAKALLDFDLTTPQRLLQRRIDWLKGLMGEQRYNADVLSDAGLPTSHAYLE